MEEGPDGLPRLIVRHADPISITTHGSSGSELMKVKLLELYPHGMKWDPRFFLPQNCPAHQPYNLNLPACLVVSGDPKAIRTQPWVIPFSDCKFEIQWQPCAPGEFMRREMEKNKLPAIAGRFFYSLIQQWQTMRTRIASLLKRNSKAVAD